MKVLHIVESFNGQAIEQWLLQLVVEINRQGESVDWDFYCTLDVPGKYSEAVTSRGMKIFCSLDPISKPLLFLKGLRHVVKAGRYDVVHCHHDIMSAFYLTALVGLPVRKRIIHVHNTSLPLPTPNRYKAMIGSFLLKSVGCILADHIVGVSQPALDAYPGSGWMGYVSNSSIIHCGVDLARFSKSSVNENDYRKRLGIPDGSKVLLFVGRMIEYKNPVFILDILENLPTSCNDVYAIFAGAGPLEEAVFKSADKKGLSSRVRVLGRQEDIPSIMQSCDLLIWPGVEEPMEGLGLGVVEAQAAGLKVVMSRSIPIEAIVIPELVDVVPLAGGAKEWAEKVIAALGRNSLQKDEALQRVERSSFSISESALNILKLYNS